MTSRKKFKYAFIAVVFIIAGLALADALGAFNPKPYKAVRHGSHVHYVPNDRDPSVPLDDFPMKKPGPHEKISPTGQILPKN